MGHTLPCVISSAKVQVEHPPRWARLDWPKQSRSLGNSDAAIRVLVAAERDANPVTRALPPDAL